MRNYCSLAYSALACLRIGIPGSASFQSAKKSWKAYYLFGLSFCNRSGCSTRPIAQRFDFLMMFVVLGGPVDGVEQAAIGAALRGQPRRIRHVWIKSRTTKRKTAGPPGQIRDPNVRSNSSPQVSNCPVRSATSLNTHTDTPSNSACASVAERMTSTSNAAINPARKSTTGSKLKRRSAEPKKKPSTRLTSPIVESAKPHPRRVKTAGMAR
jgi:hypothetical protein